MFIVYAIKELFLGIVRFFVEFGRGLFIAIKFRALEFDSKLQYKFTSQMRILIWLGIAAIVCIILYFILGYIGNIFYGLMSYTGGETPTE